MILSIKENILSNTVLDINSITCEFSLEELISILKNRENQLALIKKLSSISSSEEKLDNLFNLGYIEIHV